MKKVLIIGGGISGLTAGIFAQKAGFESIIYEKHSIPGGECTGWDRDGYHIDGCIQWLTGTKDGDEFNTLWKQVGALGNVKIHKLPKFITVEYEGKQISVDRDLNLLKEHLLEISPEDKSEIENLVAWIETLANSSMPIGKPFDMMNLWEIIKFGAPMKEASKIINVLTKMSVPEYSSRFKSPLIRKLFNKMMPPKYNAVGLLSALATFVGGNGDLPAGGSRAMAERMADQFTSLGGKLEVNTEVEEVLIDGGIAKGVLLKNGHTEFGSYIIPACDTDITFNKLLKGKYIDRKFAARYSDPQRYPLASCVYLSFAVDADLRQYPVNFVFETTPFTCGNKTFDEVSFHHYCYDNFAPENKSIIISAITTDYEDYLFWKKLNENPVKYQEVKLDLAQKIIDRIETRFPELKGKIRTLDVATPLTYERYCGAFQGAWMSFVTTPQSKMMMHDGKIRGIKNLFMAGQWLMPPGGLPVALITGKWAVQRICKKERISFIQ
jgi:phytoene desaturase